MIEGTPRSSRTHLFRVFERQLRVDTSEEYRRLGLRCSRRRLDSVEATPREKKEKDFHAVDRMWVYSNKRDRKDTEEEEERKKEILEILFSAHVKKRAKEKSEEEETHRHTSRGALADEEEKSRAETYAFECGDAGVLKCVCLQDLLYVHLA